MPLYMDIHNIPGVKALDVAEAHAKDLLLQDKHRCKCLTYWIDEDRENVFCLIEAPDKEAVSGLHQKAHGLLPSRVIEVKSELVQSFLGRIYDPVDARTAENGLKVFDDTPFRTLLVIKITDPILLKHTLGREKADGLLQRQNEIIRKALAESGGTEAEHDGDGFIVSFLSAGKAVSCAIAIENKIDISDIDTSGLRIGINAGEPIAGTDKLFGAAIQLASCLCAASTNSKITLASSVRNLLAKDLHDTHKNNLFSLAPQDEDLIQSLFHQLESNWTDPDFNVEKYVRNMAMSNSQLYRKTVELCGLSPNSLLMNFRLGKARELLRQRRFSISQITFDSGFTSPSYFTKCFKKKYGLLPMAYIDLLR